jgi:hypothetical protein
MVKLAEYGDLKDGDHATVTVLRRAKPCAYKLPRVAEIVLESVTAGFECAGSVARWTEGYFAVRWHDHGAGQGRRYRALAEAEAHFERLLATSKLEVLEDVTKFYRDGSGVTVEQVLERFAAVHGETAFERASLREIAELAGRVAMELAY